MHGSFPHGKHTDNITLHATHESTANTHPSSRQPHPAHHVAKGGCGRRVRCCVCQAWHIKNQELIIKKAADARKPALRPPLASSSASNIPCITVQSHKSQDQTRRKRGESGDFVLRKAFKNGSIHFARFPKNSISDR